MTSEKCTRAHVQEKKVYIYLYISPYENLFENGCIYIYIYIYSRIFENIPQNGPEYSHRNLMAIARFLVIAVRKKHRGLAVLVGLIAMLSP